MKFIRKLLCSIGIHLYDFESIRTDYNRDDEVMGVTVEDVCICGKRKFIREYL